MEAILNPERIVLKDGRSYEIKDLLRARTRAQVYNLRQRRVSAINHRNYGLTKSLKYSMEERGWIAEAAIPDIMARYGKNELQARQIKYQSIQIVGYGIKPGPIAS